MSEETLSPTNTVRAGGGKQKILYIAIPRDVVRILDVRKGDSVYWKYGREVSGGDDYVVDLQLQVFRSTASDGVPCFPPPRPPGRPRKVASTEK